MAKLVWTNAFFSIGGTDVSNRVRKVTLDVQDAEVDVTAMGAGAYREKLPGMKDWTIDADLYEDFAVGALDSILFPLIGTTVAIEVHPDATAAVSATNPRFTGNAALVDYKPFDADVGVAAVAAVRLHAAGALTRATS